MPSEQQTPTQWLEPLVSAGCISEAFELDGLAYFRNSANNFFGLPNEQYFLGEFRKLLLSTPYFREELSLNTKSAEISEREFGIDHQEINKIGQGEKIISHNSKPAYISDQNELIALLKRGNISLLVVWHFICSIWDKLLIIAAMFGIFISVSWFLLSNYITVKTVETSVEVISNHAERIHQLETDVKAIEAKQTHCAATISLKPVAIKQASKKK